MAGPVGAPLVPVAQLSQAVVNASVQEWQKKLEDERQKSKNFFGFGGSKLTPIELQMGEMILRVGAHIVAQDVEIRALRENNARLTDNVDTANRLLSNLEVKRETFCSEAMQAVNAGIQKHVAEYEHRARRGHEKK